MNIDETIDAFRRGALDLDCKKIVLRQRKDGGEVYEGPGYIRQTPEGGLTFKLYVVGREHVRPLATLNSWLQGIAGKLHSPDLFYDFLALAHDGTIWTASRVLPVFNWDMRDESAIGTGLLPSVLAELDRPAQADHYLRLHFFEEYDVPLHLMSRVEQQGGEYMIRDHAEFKACNCSFEARVREGSGDTIIEATSAAAFPPAFEARIQEALQYLTGKSAFWRARAVRSGDKLHVELLSPWRKASRTQLDAPISRASIEFNKHGWNLFGTYLAYVAAHTEGPHWNPVAYHLYNACEASAGSVDAFAVGVSIAVEAVAHLIRLPTDTAQAARVAHVQERTRNFLNAQTDLDDDLIKRMDGLIGSMGNKRPQDVLHALAKTGRVEKAYISAWDDLRNRHVHPKPKDLKQPQGVDYQELLDRIHRTEVLLRQLTFHLIGYEGPYTDYGANNFPPKNYPGPPSEPPATQGTDTTTTPASANTEARAPPGSALKRLFGMALYTMMAGVGFAFLDALGRIFGDKFRGLAVANFSSAVAGYTALTLFLGAVAAMIYQVSRVIDRAFFETLDDRVLAKRLERAALIVGLTFGGFFPVN